MRAAEADMAKPSTLAKLGSPAPSFMLAGSANVPAAEKSSVIPKIGLNVSDPITPETAPVKQAAAGWYDDRGRQRWWDGTAWSDTFQDGRDVSGQPIKTVANQPVKRRVPLAAFWAAVAGALVLGLAIGGGLGAAGKAATPASLEAPVSTPDDTVASQAAAAPVTPALPAAPAVPAEYLSALTKAQEYSGQQHMSKAGLYAQLTSAYGEQFSAAAGQYAVDHVIADWNANSLAKAREYQSQQSMSPAAIYDQLTSPDGEQFLPSEADYAIAHLNG